MRTHYRQIKRYITKDGSEIRELLHPDHHDISNQSLAEARVPAGVTTYLHRHLQSEEIYHITAGSGEMTLGSERFSVEPGDSVCIPPGTAHCITSTGNEPLVILCCCAPAYAHEDTELLLEPDC